MAGSDQPDQRVWVPSRGSPQAGGGQSPGPADWPAPRKAPGPQTWQQWQRRKAVSDRLGALHGELTAGTHAHIRLTRGSTAPTTTLARAPRTQGPHPPPPSDISSRPTGVATHQPGPARGLSCPADRGGLLVHAPLCSPHPQALPASPLPPQKQHSPPPSLGQAPLTAPHGSPVVTPTHPPAPQSEDRAEPTHTAWEPNLRCGFPDTGGTCTQTAGPTPRDSHSAGLSAAQECAGNRHGPRRLPTST